MMTLYTNDRLFCYFDALYSQRPGKSSNSVSLIILEEGVGVKDKVLGAGEDAKDIVTGHDEDRYTTGAGQKDDPLTSYRDKEPMTPAKIKEHEPTAVKREMTERIAESGQTGTGSEEAAEIARKKGMAKGTAGAAETGSEYEQGSAGSNK